MSGVHITLALGEESLSAVSDVSGRFEFLGLKSGRYQIDVACKHCATYAGSIQIHDGERRILPAIMLEDGNFCGFSSPPMVPQYRVDKILGDKAEIVGRVVPPYGVDVELKTMRGIEVSSVHGSTDRRGEFRFSDVAPGRHRLYITPDEPGGFLIVNPMDLVGHPGESLVIEPIRLQRPPPPRKGQPITVCE